MIEVFSDVIAGRKNALSRQDARVKLIVVLTALAALLLSRRPWLPLAFLAADLSLVATLRLPPRLVLWRMAAPAGMVLVLVVLKSLLSNGTPLGSVSLGPWKLTVWREGLVEGALLGLRVLSAVSVMVVFGAVTPAHEVLRALHWMGLPAAWVEIALLMYRYTFVLVDELEDMAQAQRVRLGYTTPRRALASVGQLAGVVLVRSIDQAQRTGEAMGLRLYRGQMPLATLEPLRGRQAAALLLTAGSIAALFGILEGR